jgi:hypothetical protein
MIGADMATMKKGERRKEMRRGVWHCSMHG